MGIVCDIQAIVPIISMLLIIASGPMFGIAAVAGVFYALVRNSDAKLAGIAMKAAIGAGILSVAMLIGAVAGIILVVVAPSLLGGNANC